MSDITLRLDKGTPLTNQEVDDNFDNLNADKYESGDSPLFVDIDADTIQLLGGTGTQGTLSWNADEETVDLIQNGATLQLGQEVQIHCRNATGSTIANGVAVYATGTIGNSGRITIAPMIADGTIPAKYVLGITTEEIPNGEDGKVTTFGKVRELDTTAYSDGDVLYISPTTAGALTATEPTAPNISLPVAFVIHAHANGSLFTRVTPFDENAYATAAQGSTADSALQNVSEDTTPQLGGNLDTNGNDIAFGDNDKATFGASDDLQIYHDGSDSYVTDAGTGYLNVLGTGLVRLGHPSNGQTYINAYYGGDVELFFANAKKLSTTSTGVDVTGTVTADGLTVDGGTQIVSNGIPTLDATITGLQISRASYPQLIFDRQTSAAGEKLLGIANDQSSLLFRRFDDTFTTAAFLAKLGANGDLSLYDDTGTTPKFFWDASAESLGIGTTSPATALDVRKSTGDLAYFIPTTAGHGSTYISSSSNKAEIGTGLTSTEFSVRSKGNGGFLTFDTSGAERMRIDSSGNVGIGTTSPSFKLDVAGNARAAYFALRSNEATPSESSFIYRPSTGVLGFGTGTVERMRIDSSGNLLVGKTATGFGTAGIELHGQADQIYATSTTHGLAVNRLSTDGDIAKFYKDGTTVGKVGSISGAVSYIVLDPRDSIGAGLAGASRSIRPTVETGATTDNAIDLGADNVRFKDLYLSGGLRGDTLTFSNLAGSERMRIDSSGNVLVGTTDTNPAGNNLYGVAIRPAGYASSFTGEGGQAINLNRKANDGAIAAFYKDGTSVGNIRSVSGDSIAVGTADTGLRFANAIKKIHPYDIDSGTNSDNLIDLGDSNKRFDDIYATNGTIQTSDRNEKQDIAELSDAEQRVAVAAKGLLRKFRWKDSVAEKGDEARIHFGIIAQDLQDAFTAEGLDAGDYAMFISTTWTDEETGEERTRMGVRYSELLAFIISAL